MKLACSTVFGWSKLSHPALGTNTKVMKVKQDLLHSDLPLQVDQSKLSHWNPRQKGRRLAGVTCSCCAWRSAHW